MLVSYAQNFEDVMLWRALGHLGKGYYIDIGAQDPVVDSVSLAFHERGWRGVHVEPVARYAALLRKSRPGDIVIQAAVGTKRGQLQLYVFPDTGLSTAERGIAARHVSSGFKMRRITVPCIHLSDVFARCTEREVHWLKIDVEGHERSILRGWNKKAPIHPWIVVIESTLPLTQAESHRAWEPLLLRRGYRFAYFDGLNRFYVSEAHPELLDAFRCGPNVFDNFTLNGTASAPFCISLNNSRQALTETVQERDATVAQLQSQDEKLTAELQQRQQVIADGTIQIQGLTQTLWERDATVAQLQSQGAKLAAELQQRQQVIADGAIQIQGLTQTVQALEAAAAQLRSHGDKLAGELVQREQAIAQGNARILERDAAIAKLRARHERLISFFAAMNHWLTEFRTIASRHEQALAMTLSPASPSNFTELLAQQGQDFVVHAYRLVLGREPDAGGLQNYLDQLSRGESKQNIILGIRCSPEGRRAALAVPGLALGLVMPALCSLPLVGWLLQFATRFLTLGSIEEKQRALEYQYALRTSQARSEQFEINRQLALLSDLLVRFNTGLPATLPEGASTAHQGPSGDQAPAMALSTAVRDISEGLVQTLHRRGHSIKT